jgi:hypothetical protein
LQLELRGKQERGGERREEQKTKRRGRRLDRRGEREGSVHSHHTARENVQEIVFCFLHCAAVNGKKLNTERE